MGKRYYAAKSIRMCVVCRKKDLQKELIRFKFTEDELLLYDGNGRSFYLCFDCLGQKKTYNSVKKIVKKANDLIKQLEEISQICQK